MGRFLQEDTYRGDGLNLYAYCANNPVVYYDPSGHISTESPCAIEGTQKPTEETLAGGVSATNLDDGLGTYADQRGHHVMAKKSF